MLHVPSGSGLIRYKKQQFGIQKMFPLPEGDNYLSGNYALTHSAQPVEATYCSRYTQHSTGCFFSGLLHVNHCEIVRLPLHVSNNSKKQNKTWETFIVLSFKECRIISNNMSCAWLLVWETLPITFHPPCEHTTERNTSFSSMFFKYLIQRYQQELRGLFPNRYVKTLVTLRCFYCCIWPFTHH